jgi:hypothetical protein
MVFARKIASTLKASCRLFGTYIRPNPLNYPTGRDIFKKPLMERTVKDQYVNKLLSYDMLKIPWRFVAKQETQYWRTFRRMRKGLTSVKKGQGKKALKRKKEADKAAAIKAKEAKKNAGKA